MSEERPASARFPINRMAMSLIALACARVLVQSQFFGNPWPYFQGVLTVAAWGVAFSYVVPAMDVEGSGTE